MTTKIKNYIVNAESIISGEHGFHLSKGDIFPNYLENFDYDLYVGYGVLKLVEREDQGQDNESVQGETFEGDANKIGSRRKR